MVMTSNAVQLFSIRFVFTKLVAEPLNESYSIR